MATTTGSAGTPTSLPETLRKYDEERDKRLRPERYAQYIDLDMSDQLKRFAEDPWAEQEGPQAARLNIPDDSRCKVLILGAGLSGVLCAVRLIQQGVDARDIRLVDRAAGFGGAWYWNRFPGLMCDMESYSYLPLLEETGYVPKNRYSYGPEIRDYFKLVAEKWELEDKAFFQTEAKAMVWDDVEKEWTTELVQKAKGQEERKFSIRSQFAMIASGILFHPKIPEVPGVQEFRGDVFHSSRWDYGATGGSPEDDNLSKLKDKSVGIVGTAATCVQVLPHLARCAKQVYVFQRTPASVDYRDQRKTDTEKFKEEVATGPGWQKERQLNLASHHYAPLPPPEKNLVNDAWNNRSTYSGLMGCPVELTMDNLGEFLAQLNAIDLDYNNGIRARVDEFVHDRAVADKLKAWYPTWCKRSVFHDEYLPTFNRPNVKLVDTDGRGIDGLTAGGVRAGGEEHPVDVLVFSTGYRAVFIGSPAAKAGITVTGRDGRSFEDKYEGGFSTLHGVVSHGFPNLFLQNMSQGPVAANACLQADCIARHIAHIVAAAAAKTEGAARGFAIEPSAEAEAAWTDEIAKRALVFASATTCTPSYFNAERTEVAPEEQMKQMKMAPWGHGITEWLKVAEAWREKGDLEGLVVTLVQS